MTPRVGVDVAAIPRIAEAQKRFGDRFLRKFLSDQEIAYCGDSAERWAGRWAAKEAIGKALRHHKLPDQDQVRRIYNEIESKDERLELNLYIVGEDGGEEEGAQAEGSQES